MYLKMIIGNIYIPSSLQIYLRSIDTGKLCELTQYKEDIWQSDVEVSEHTDNTQENLMSYLCVLVNDGKYVFRHGKEQFDLIPGSLHKFNGNIPHAALGKIGRLAILVWDMPDEYSTEDFKSECKIRITDLNNRRNFENIT
jgi:hypothetical protein